MGYINAEGPEVSNPLKYFTFNAQMDRYSSPGIDYITRMQQNPIRLDNPLDKLKDLLGKDFGNYNLTSSFYRPGTNLPGKRDSGNKFYDRFSHREPQISMPNRYTALSKNLNYLQD
ncbi:hypothetical protein HZA96_06925 [Candidatus Woesearchaeota archaeon]|nr:hypothetical protein [Candidatus Woesearchaeota archaeon]